jgi:hypothetical protein
MHFAALPAGADHSSILCTSGSAVGWGVRLHALVQPAQSAGVIYLGCPDRGDHQGRVYWVLGGCDTPLPLLIFTYETAIESANCQQGLPARDVALLTQRLSPCPVVATAVGYSEEIAASFKH